LQCNINISSSSNRKLKKQLNIGTERALEKIRQYCGYQERNHREVREKLYSMGLYTDQVEEIIGLLISENFLNEERYALAFAGGKFRMKGWGKVKIRYEMKMQGISDYCIRKALQSIDEEAYAAMLEKYFQQKARMLQSEKNHFIKKTKIRNYLLQKGYESDLVNDIIQNNTNNG